MKKTYDVRLSCRCGNVQGLVRDVNPETSNHGVCLCDDCQIYGKFLGGDFLDANGGTEVTQVAHKQIELSQGREHVACVRLYSKGMHRWYARCCKTPLANTMGAKGVFAGVVHACLQEPLDGSPLQDAIGPIRGRVQGRFGKGELPPGTQRVVSVSMALRSARCVLVWWMGGGAKSSTFFVEGAPFATPQVLSAEERGQLV